MRKADNKIQLARAVWTRSGEVPLSARVAARAADDLVHLFKTTRFVLCLPGNEDAAELARCVHETWAVVTGFTLQVTVAMNLVDAVTFAADKERSGASHEESVELASRLFLRAWPEYRQALDQARPLLKNAVRRLASSNKTATRWPEVAKLLASLALWTGKVSSLRVKRKEWLRRVAHHAARSASPKRKRPLRAVGVGGSMDIAMAFDLAAHLDARRPRSGAKRAP